MVDEFRAADTYYYFDPPLCYKSPMNTEEVFKQFVNNPEEFNNFILSMEYFAIRYDDITKDLNKIKSHGGDTQNLFKYYYYKGFQECLKQIIMNQPITPKG